MIRRRLLAVAALLLVPLALASAIGLVADDPQDAFGMLLSLSLAVGAIGWAAGAWYQGHDHLHLDRCWFVELGGGRERGVPRRDDAYAAHAQRAEARVMQRGGVLVGDPGRHLRAGRRGEDREDEHAQQGPAPHRSILPDRWSPVST